MSEVKQHLTYQEQIEKLRSRGCIINNDTLCEEILENTGYYRLSSYFLPFKTESGKYKENLTLERVYHIYEFDRKLRDLLFTAIEVIEVSLRSRLSYFHSKKYGPLGYLGIEKISFVIPAPGNL